MDRVTGRSFATRSEVLGRQGMVATSQPLATLAGVDILRDGGTAVDACIAANAVLGVVEPTGCGVGGDLFAILWHAKSRKLFGLNGSGRSPYGLTLEHFKREGFARIPQSGPLSVSVPGAVDGWFALHKKFGHLPFKRLLAPATGLARDGFPVTEYIAYAWAQNGVSFGKYPGFRETFMPGGRTPRKGDIFRNLDLAKTYQSIVRGGRDAFYRGEIARALTRFVQSVGGFLSARDLEDHASNWVSPISTRYRGFDIWELPPNGQGIAALQMLNLLEGFDLRGAGFGSPDHLHYFIEAKKLAFEDRAQFYADPEFNRIPVRALISKSYARRRRKLIHPGKAGRAYDAGHPGLRKGDTVYLAAADRWGNMASWIQSNFRGMGSGLVPHGLGFGLQNRGELFTLEEGHFNVYAPHKRPFHTIVPAFITRGGRPWAAFGVMGGDTQPQGHVQIVTNVFDFGMNLQEAGDAPRAVHSGSSSPTGGKSADGGVVHLESGFSYETVRQLIKRGHRVEPKIDAYGGYQAVRWDEKEGVYHGASESRKDGCALGY